MLNQSGALAVMDRGITLNWDDGPTLHRITAQVRYHTAASATSQLIRVQATRQPDDDTLIFIEEGPVRTVWAWQERPCSGETDSLCAWATQMLVTNNSDEEIYLDTIDVIRIDSANLGQFNLGAPPRLWQCARENSDRDVSWVALSEISAGVAGCTRSNELLVQPSLSNRSRPPAVIVCAKTDPAQAGPEHSMPAEIKLEFNGERFERFVACNRADGALLEPGATLVSSEFMIACGDDANELRKAVVNGG